MEVSKDLKIKILKIIGLSIGLVLFLALTFIVLATSVNVPVWDAWHNPSLFEKLYSGNLVFYDLYRDVNGHRILFPRLIILGLGHVTHYDVRWELGVNLLLGAFIYVIYIKFVLNKLSLEPVPFFVAMIALPIILFSLVQYENWYFGWQICYFLAIAMSLFSISLLVNCDRLAALFFLAVTVAFIATYSFASSVLIWPLGLVVLILNKQSVRLMGMWAFFGLVCTISYFHGLTGESVFEANKSLDYLIYFLMYLGAPLSMENHLVAMIWGGMGLLAMIYIIYTNHASADFILPRGVGKSTHRVFLLLLMASIFSILNGVMIGIARLGFGSEYALLSRYTSFSSIFWISLIFLLLMAHSFSHKKFERNYIIFFIMIIMIASIKNTMRCVDKFYIHKNRMILAVRELKKENISMMDMRYVQNITWNVDFTIQQARILKEYNLSFYHE